MRIRNIKKGLSFGFMLLLSMNANARLHLPQGGAVTEAHGCHRTSPAPPCGQVQALVSILRPRRHPDPLSSCLFCSSSLLSSLLLSSVVLSYRVFDMIYGDLLLWSSLILSCLLFSSLMICCLLFSSLLLYLPCMIRGDLFSSLLLFCSVIFCAVLFPYRMLSYLVLRSIITDVGACLVVVLTERC